MKQKILRYGLAMNASAFQAGAHAAKVFLGLAVAHCVAGSIPALNLSQLVAVFAFAFAYELLDWLDAHPVSDLIPEADNLGRLNAELTAEIKNGQSQPAPTKPS